MKTLFLYDGCQEKSYFFEKDGDYRHLDGVYVNGEREELWDELLSLIPENEDLHLKAPTKDWDYFVRIGFWD